MRLISTSAIASFAILTASTLPGAAAVIENFGAYNPRTAPYHQYFGNDVSGSFTDDYTFSINGTGPLMASITNSFVSTTDQISDFTLSLYKGIPDSGSRLDFVHDGGNGW